MTQGHASIQWLTTLPNPHVRATGYDAGQRGWRLHAVEAEPTTMFSTIRRQRALCGLLPGHGWCVDLFIDEPCSRCVRAARDRGIPVSDEIEQVVRREDMRRRVREGKYTPGAP